VTDEPLIQQALSTLERHEADVAVCGTSTPTPTLPLAQALLLAVYMHERRRHSRLSPGDARPHQLIKAARDAHIPEGEIQAALDLAKT
jgi:hypothetical protein